MPWDIEPKKDVPDCDMPRQVVKKRYSRGFPNGETFLSEPQEPSCLHEGGKPVN